MASAINLISAFILGAESRGQNLDHNLTKYGRLTVLGDGTAYGCASWNLVFGDIRTGSIKGIICRMCASEIVKQLADRNSLKGKFGVYEYKPLLGCRVHAQIYSKDYLGRHTMCPYKSEALG